MESLSDIVASMRRGTKLPGYWRSCDLNKILAYHADRIEAAWKLEREAVTNCNHLGNAAAMRDALLIVKRLFDGRIMFQPAIRKAHEAVDAALAAPARQCDVGTADEQDARFSRFCVEKRSGSCSGCPDAVGGFTVANGIRECALVWAQTPYEAEEGAGE